MAYICPTCGKLLEIKKEMKVDEMRNRGMQEYFWCNNCRVQVKNPDVKEL